MIPFNQKIKIMIPVFLLGILGIYLIPQPYNNFAGVMMITVYWTIIMTWEYRLRKRENQEKKTRNKE